MLTVSSGRLLFFILGLYYCLALLNKQGLDLIEPAADIEGGKFVCRNGFHGSSRVICFLGI